MILLPASRPHSHYPARGLARTVEPGLRLCLATAGGLARLDIQSDEPYQKWRKVMKTTVGLWIDHRRAVIVEVSEKGEETREIESDVEKHPGGFAGLHSIPPHESQHKMADDSRQRRFMGHLQIYYDEVIASIGDAESILIFGPGEAKGELKKRLESDKLCGRVVVMQTVDKMTDREIAAKVREYFRK